MRDADDAIVLSERERQALAGLAESIGDPWLARQLAGQDTPLPPAKRRPPRRRPAVAGPVATGVAVLLTLAGAALAVTTFMFSTVLGSLGLVMMGVGVGRLAVGQREAVIRRLSDPPARRTPGRWPPSPHTPPGAA